MKRKVSIGWSEWCELPELGLPAIKAKIDTGAKTSALHALNIQEFYREKERWVQFYVFPLQGKKELKILCQSPVLDRRHIMNSGGYQELRYVISTHLMLGNVSRKIELTLTNREPLSFRMLLGREAMKGDFLVDPAKICQQGKYTHSELRTLYELKNL